METHAEAQLGAHPQDIINAKLLDRCDFLIAVFWAKLGTPTTKEPSGTVQEIRDFSEKQGPDKVAVFFSEKRPPRNADKNELDRLNAFKEQMKSAGFYLTYLNDFERKLGRQLQMTMNRILANDTVETLLSDESLLRAQAADKL